MADIIINYINSQVEFSKVPYVYKRAIETLLRGLEDETDVVSDETEIDNDDNQ